MSWESVPICDECWRRERGTIEPVRLKEAERAHEICWYCDRSTRSGIYVREEVQ